MAGDIIAEVTTLGGLTLRPEYKLSDLDPAHIDMLVLPGGMPGTTNLGECDTLTDQVKQFAEDGRQVAAICAAPTSRCTRCLRRRRRALMS